MDLTTVGMTFAAYPSSSELFGLGGSDVVWLLAVLLLGFVAYDYYRTAMRQKEEIAKGRIALDNFIKEREELYKGRIMTRKQREKYKRKAIPDAILDGLERAWENGRLTRTEVNEAFREIGGYFKYPDLKTRKRLLIEEVETPIPSAMRQPLTDNQKIYLASHLDKVKAGILTRMQGKFKDLLWSKPKIPGDPPIQDVGPKKDKGTLFGKRRLPPTTTTT